MKPWSFLVIGLGVLFLIMGVKGSYENVVSALTGKKHFVPGGTTGSGKTSGVLLPQQGTQPVNPTGGFPFIGPSHHTPGNVMA